MPIDVQTPESPGWWMQRCSTKLETRRKRIDPLFARYEGTQPLLPALKDAPPAARQFFATARTAFAEMIVKAPRYRLRVTGIVTPGSSDESGDANAFALWKSAGMDTEQDDVHRLSLIAGDAYVIASKYLGQVAATAEDPRQVITIHDPVRQSIILAASKVFHDDVDDRDVAYLFRPDGATGRRWVAYRPRKSAMKSGVRFTGSGWEWDETKGGVEGESLPVPMPVVRYRNEEGVGEFERHLPHLDRIDHVILQAMWIVTMQAFRQRAIHVSEEDMPSRDKDTGELIDYANLFESAPDALWKLPETAKMWESGVVDTTPVSGLASKEIERLSAVTFTPMSMFSSDAVNQSAAGASLVKEGLTTKVEDKWGRLGASHAQTMALLGQIAELDGLTDPALIGIQWRPADRYSLSEKGDASVKAASSGVPWKTRMRTIWQFDPADIARMETERMDDALLSATMAAPVPAETRVAAAPAVQA